MCLFALTCGSTADGVFLYLANAEKLKVLLTSLRRACRNCGLFSVQVVRAVSHLPAGSNAQSAAAAVRALGPRYAGVTAVDSGIVDVLTKHEKPAGAEEEEEDAAKNRREEEMAHEQLLFGMEVREGRGEGRGEGGELAVVNCGAFRFRRFAGLIDVRLGVRFPPASVSPRAWCLRNARKNV